jgi:tetratricopeptide (TPR) repeat protein
MRAIHAALGAALLAHPAITSAQSPPTATTRKPAATAADVERRLSEAARKNPDSFDAHYALASFYLQQGRLETAIPHLERARAIDPSNYSAGYDLALARLETGAMDKARAEVEKMLAAKETGELHNLLGDIEERTGNLKAAAEEYQRAARIDPTEEHLFDWGNNLVQMRAFEPAAQVFTAAIARHPKSARLRVGLGITHYWRREYEQAVTLFCEAVDLDPKDPRPYQFLGETVGVAPQLGAEITERLARFVKAQPGNAQAHLHYALSLWKGQSADVPPAGLRRIEALLRRAVALDPTITRAHFELGILLSDQERYKEAIQALREAVRLDPDLAQAHYRLAQAYQRTGEKGLAAKELEIFRKLKERP